jgi:GT2 family glycosyltransferase
MHNKSPQPHSSTENQSLVSVVIPTFNRAQMVCRAIDSVLGQTHRALEILVIDDGSTDNTAEDIARRYGTEERVNYVYQSNAGVSAARNHALRLARGAFIGFLDSDDTWKTWKIQLQLLCLRIAPTAGMIWTDMEAIDSAGRVMHARYLRKMYGAYEQWSAEKLFQEQTNVDCLAIPGGAQLGNARLYWGDVFSPMMTGNLVHTSTVLLRRERLAQVRQFREDFRPSGEDYDFHLRTCSAGPVAFLDLPSIGYTIGAADQLTKAEYHVFIAQNALRTIEPFIRNERPRIKLSDATLQDLLAKRHLWIGDELLRLGQYSQARRHLRTSVRHRPMRPRVYLLLAATFIPLSMTRAALELYRRIRRALSKV